MAARLKAVAPLVVSIGVLAFLATELALNFTFHWVTVQDGVFGKYGVPQNIQLALPAIFVGWGLYFLLGATNAALSKTVIAAAHRHDRSPRSRWCIGPELADVARLLGTRADDRDHRRRPGRALDRRRGRPLRARARVLLLRVGVLLVDRHRPGQLRARTARARTPPRPCTAAITNKPLSAGTGAFGGLLSMSVGSGWRSASSSRSSSAAVFGLASVKLAGVLGGLDAAPGPRLTSPRSPSAPAIATARAAGSSSSSASVRGSSRRRPSSMRPISGGSPARSARGERVRAGPGSATTGPGQLEQRQRAAADPGDRLDDLGARRSAAASRCARARLAASPRSIASTGISSGASRCSRSVASSAASESLSIRSARASGCARARARPPSARPTSSPACGPPSSLSPEKHDQRRAGRDRAAHRRLVVQRARARPSRRRRSPARRARTAPRSRTSSTNPSWRKFDWCTRRIAPVSAVDRALVVGEPRAVRRADLDQPRARLRDHVRHAEPAADLDQLPARDDHLAARPGERRRREQRRARAVVDREPGLGAGQLAQQRLDVRVPRPARAGLQVELEVRVALGRPRHRLARGRGQRRPARGSCARSRRSR